MNDALQIERNGAVLTLWLNRPELHNAFDAGLIARLTAALEAAGRDDTVRTVVVAGQGASFSAGADMQWMRGMATASEADNREDALALARLMRTLDELPKPTLARVHGAAFGGGVGLVACCDIAIATSAARFGLTESRLGLLPAVISPYVIEAIGSPDDLEQALENAEAVRISREYVDAYGLGYAQERLDVVEMPAFSGVLGITNAQSTSGD